MKRAGFSLNEIIIVVTIVVIISAAAITGTARIIDGVRFGNTFNKLILMVQEARNLAIAGRLANGVAASYEVVIDTYKNKIILNALEPGNEDAPLDKIKIIKKIQELNLENITIKDEKEKKLLLYGVDASNSKDGSGGTPCPNYITIRFVKNTGEMRTDCPGGTGGAKILKVYLYARDYSRNQILLVTRASGLIQIGRRY